MSFLNRIIDNKFFPHAFFLLTAFLWVGRGIDFQFLTNFFNSGDTFQFFNFDRYLRAGFFVWDSVGPGRIPPMSFIWSSYSIMFKFFSLFFSNKIIVVNIIWILLTYFFQVSFYLFYKIFLGRNYAIVATLLSIFNVFFILLFHTPLHLNFIGFLAFPFIYYLFHSYYFEGKFILIFYYVVFHLLLFRNLNILIIVNFFVPILFYFLNKDEIKLKFFTKKISTFWIIIMFVVSMLIVNGYVFYSNSETNKTNDSYNKSALSISPVSSLKNIFRMTTNYGFLGGGGNEAPGSQAKDFSVIYLGHPTFIFVSYLFYLLFFLSLFYNEDKNNNQRKHDIILFFICFFIFFSKGLNPPMAQINEIFYLNSIFLLFFRSGAKYFVFILFPLVVLYMLWRIKKTYIINAIIFVIIFSHFFLAIVAFKPIHAGWNSTLPEEYLSFAEFLEKERTVNKFLVLPITKHFIGYTNYLDGYAGPDRLLALSSKSFLTKASSVVISNEYLDLIEKIRNDYKLLEDYSSILNYKYLIVEKDTISVLGREVDDYLTVLNFIDDSIWENRYEDKKFILFSIKDIFFHGKIYTSNNDRLQIIKINDTRYNLNIKLKDRATLYFQEAFSRNWGVFLNKFKGEENCLEPIYYKKTNVFECKENNKIFEINKSGDIEVFGETHKLANEYANEWTIDPEYIKQNFSNEYYRENPDGSIDVEMSLYFKPQTYYYLGLAISFVTLSLSFFYAVFDYFKKINETES